MKTIIKMYVPVTLDLKQLNKEAEKVIPNFKPDHLAYILGTINEIAFRNADYAKDSGYVKLSSKILKSHIRDYKPILNFLIKSNVIETDGTYRRGVDSLGYRFKSHLEGIKKIDVTVDARKHIKVGNRDEEQTRRHKFLAKWLNSNLTIDREAAIKEIEEYKRKQESLLHINPDNPSESYERLLNEHDTNYLARYSRWMTAIEKIHEGDTYYSVDRFSHRFHSNITNLKSELRKHLRYEGKKIVSLDIKNSQPYMSLCLFNEPFINFVIKTQVQKVPSSESLNDITNNKNDDNIFNINKIYSTIGRRILIPSSLLLLMRQQLSKTKECQDFRTYTEMVSSGLFYDWMADEFRRRGIEGLGTRGEVKKMMFVVFFSHNQFLNQSDAAPKKRFAELFPSVYEMFKIIKRIDNSMLARLLQVIESHIILRVVCRRITKERPDVPLFTIHDSIATTVENKDYVYKVMMEELTRHVGVPPVIKEEFWR